MQTNATFYYVSAAGDHWFYPSDRSWGSAMNPKPGFVRTDRVVRTKAHADRVARHLLGLGSTEVWISRRIVNYRRFKIIDTKAWTITVKR